MRRIGVALALSLLVGLALLAEPASAHHRRAGFHVGCCVFVDHGHPFVHHKVFVDPHFRGLRHHFFFAHPNVGSTVIVVEPTRQPVWVPGFWWWNGFQWVWAPGHWSW